MKELLSGKKTYVMGGLMIALGLLGMVMPEMTAQLGLTLSPVELIGLGLTTIFGRLGISKVS